MSVKLSPIWTGMQFFSSAGQPLSGGKIYQYLAGTTTPATTYTDSTGSVSNANPIILDSTGRYSAQIWFTTGASYKLVLTDSTGTTILTEDNLTGVNDTASVNASEWVTSGFTPTYTSGGNTFTVPGNQTSIFVTGRRLQLVDSGTTYYATVTASSGAGPTTVTVLMDSGVLDSGLTVVNYSLLNGANESIPLTNVIRPAFHAHLSVNQISSAVTIIYQTVDNQQGSGYSSGTGLFTAPLTGWYSFFASVLMTNNSGGTVANGIEIVVNSLQVSGTSIDQVTGTARIYSTGVVAYMVAGQTAFAQGQAVFNANNFATSSVSSSFSGVLVS